MRRSSQLAGDVGTGDVAWSPDGRWIATAADDATVRIWDAGTGAPRFTITGHTAAVWRVRLEPRQRPAGDGER